MLRGGTSWVSDELTQAALLFSGGLSDVSLRFAQRPRDTFSYDFLVQVTSSHQVDGQSTSGVGGVHSQRYVFGATNEGSRAAGSGLSIGTNGISVYEHGNNYMPALAVFQGSLATDRWHHVAISYEDKRPRIFLNGVLVRTGARSPRTAVYAPITLGAGAYGSFSGKVAELSFSCSSVTAVEAASRCSALLGSDACGTSTVTCSCAPGWTGPTCEENIDECASLPCKHGGTCVDGVNSFSCSCFYGWGGPTCEVFMLGETCEAIAADDCGACVSAGCVMCMEEETTLLYENDFETKQSGSRYGSSCYPSLDFTPINNHYGGQGELGVTFSQANSVETVKLHWRDGVYSYVADPTKDPGTAHASNICPCSVRWVACKCCCAWHAFFV